MTGLVRVSLNVVSSAAPLKPLKHQEVMTTSFYKPNHRLASQAGNAHPSRPPASRKVVAALPVVTLDEEAAAKATAAGEKCPVCCEHWQPGEEQQQLPCGHSFHPACNAPWLAQHNSCAICRHE